jgi:oxalyl-CoA decarboxylase
MGVGLPFAIAAAVIETVRIRAAGGNARRVVTVQGDSAFGFSAMEFEVACRYRLPIVVIVLNNNGIYKGTAVLDRSQPLPTTALLPDAHYELLAQAFGAVGYCVSTAQQLEDSLTAAFAATEPCIVNVMIQPDGGPTPKIVAAAARH